MMRRCLRLLAFPALALCLALAALRAADEPAAKEPPAEAWWSLRPLVRPQLPASSDWARTPVDRFILAKLNDNGLSPSPAADRRTLLRRVTFDLTGLPPTPEEMAAFLADESPDAYERAVDRLLASPAYGERWARHWMDVAHYGDSHGHDQDRPRPNAWPYRDYLVRSFNDDKPYARFVQEQVAGDVLFPDDPRAVAGLGFLASGPWDESSLRDIQENTLDRQIARYLDRDDMVTTAMSTFVSMTVHCARCHDHKFDPITQKDYYALQAVFAGVDKAERPFDPDPAVARRRRELLAEQARLQKLHDPADPSLLTPDAQAAAAEWEKTAASAVVVWTPLDPAKATSANGATLTRQPDLSVLSGGTRPEKDTYTVVAATDLKGVTGVRLELLTDDSLPHGGPGRQDNGNLHLNEFRVTAAPKGQSSAAKPMTLRNPAADFNQDGWTVGMAIDGNPATAWGVYPQIGKPHRAVFEFAEPVAFDGGAELTFTLEQTHGGGHLIGRLRLSVTTSLSPSANAEVPPDVARVLTTPAAQRTDKDRATLARHALEQRVGRALAALPPPQMVYAAANDFKPDGSFKPSGGPRPIHLLYRGDITKPRDLANPGALACVSQLPSRFTLDDSNAEGSRRAALAKWITDPNNPLTWRSIVNRVWHYHFDKGIVDTPNDLGKMGGKPSHPELLDWLACEFRDSGGSIKALDRLIVTSAVYRQASRHDGKAAEKDADNRLLWRMNRTRLDAEEVRDALLAASGKLDRTMYGPAVQQFNMSPGIHVTPNVDYAHFDPDRPENFRRCVYRFVFRTLPDPLLEALDCPDASQLTPARGSSVSALQALAMLNNRFVVRQGEHLAARLEREAGDTPGRVRRLYELLLQRPPRDAELKAVAEYADKHGLANACRVLVNSNEFLFVD